MKKLLLASILTTAVFAEISTISLPPAIFLEHYDKAEWQTRFGLDFASYKTDGVRLFGYGINADLQKRVNDEWFFGAGLSFFRASGSSDHYDIDSLSVPIEALAGRRFVASKDIHFALTAGLVASSNMATYDGKLYVPDQTIKSTSFGTKFGALSHIKIAKNASVEPYYTIKFEQNSREFKTSGHKTTSDYTSNTQNIGADLLFKHLIFGVMHQIPSKGENLTMMRFILRF